MNPVPSSSAEPPLSITVLGSTGSIGVSTLDVVARHADRFRVHALTGHSRVVELAAQCLRFAPERAVVGAAADVDRLRKLLEDGGHRASIQIDHGERALCEVAVGADVVMAAIVGAAGLPAALAAARAGRRLLLANKEALVVAGSMFIDAVEQGGATLLPIDSEHNAVFQCLPGSFGSHAKPDEGHGGVSRIVLTASGGPFRTTPLDRMDAITPAEACRHPNWSMGRKISVDSATMMNKGLEVIEARWLFGVPHDRIEVLIHPQSVIHSMVSYVDGSVLAQLGNPDMRTPIAHALAYPERIPSGVGPLDLAAVGRLDFEKPDLARFPCLALAYRALAAGGTAPAILNAANEVAVDAFLRERLRFVDIAAVVGEVLDTLTTPPATSLDDLLEADRRARACAAAVATRLADGPGASAATGFRANIACIAASHR